VLFVTPHCPSPDAPQAGHKTAFQFLSELATTHDVDMVLLHKRADQQEIEKAQPRLEGLVSSLTLVSVSYAARNTGWILGLFWKVAPRFCTRLSFGAVGRIKQLLASTTYDLVWAEFSQSAWIAKLVLPGTNLMLSLHDVLTQLVSSKSPFERLMMLGFTFETEKTLLERATQIRVQSVNDKWLMHTLFRVPVQKIELREPCLSSFLPNVRRLPAMIEPHSLLFWGAMARRENSDAAVHFLRDHFPDLKRKYPDAKMYVVGSNPPRELVAMSSDSIIVTGFVDDPTPYFERAGLGIAPLTVGSGIKVKVLEMLRAGLPVLSSPVGAEGIAADPNLTVVESAAFSDAIACIWEDGSS
jgi:hypothetical protein